MSPLLRRPVDPWTVVRADRKHQPYPEDVFRAEYDLFMRSPGPLFLLDDGPVFTPSPLARWHAAKAHAESVWASL